MMIGRIVPVMALTLAFGVLMSGAQPQTPPAPITEQALLDGLKNPSRWLTFSGDYTGQRHSPLKQLTPQNVAGLVPQWIFQTDVPGLPGRGLENSPLVVDGILVRDREQQPGVGLDGRTGRAHLELSPHAAGELLGVGLLRAGQPRLCDPRRPAVHGHARRAPRRARSEDRRRRLGCRRRRSQERQRHHGGAARRQKQSDHRRRRRRLLEPRLHRRLRRADGRALWRFYTISIARRARQRVLAERRGRRCAAAERLGSLAATILRSTSCIYGTGNPNPDYYGDDRNGDNLYTCSLVALDADTGKLRWHYQFTPHDVHDWDSAHVPVQADLTIGGQPRQVVMVANRNGFFYTLDREIGEAAGRQAVHRSSELGQGHRPRRPAHRARQYRHAGQMPAGQPRRHGFPAADVRSGPEIVLRDRSRDLRGLGSRKTAPSRSLWACACRAAAAFWSKDRSIQRAARDRSDNRPARWEHRYRPYPSTVSLDLTGGLMSTASGLVFTGDNDGYFYAFEAATGKELWRFQTGAPVWGSAAVTYMLDGRQWVLTTAGLTFTAFALPAAPR